MLRDGATVAHHDAMVSEEQIVREMVGRSMENRYPDRAPKIGEVVMQVRDWTVADPLRPERHAVDHVSFDLRRGEVLGFAGLMGAGRTELAMSLFGQSFGRRLSGTASIDGRPADRSTVPRAIAAGLAYVTEDRKSLGLVLEDNVRRNIPLANLRGVAPKGHSFHRRAPGVGQAEQLGRLVEGFAKRVVDGRAPSFIGAQSAHQQDLRVAAGYQQ